MEITIIIIISLMLICSLCVLIWAIALEKDKKAKTLRVKKNAEKQIKYKEVLKTSNSSAKCAEVGWDLVRSNVITTPISTNKRKLNYSDARESQHFCASVTSERVAAIDKMDGEINYGRY